MRGVAYVVWLAENGSCAPDEAERAWGRAGNIHVRFATIYSTKFTQ